MFGHVAVGDGDGSGALNDIDESIRTIREGNMIDPDVGGSEDGDGVTVTPGSHSNMVVGLPDAATLLRHDVLDANAVDDNVVDEL